MAYFNRVDPAKPLMGPPSKLNILMGWLICLGIIAVALFISYVTFVFIERPARQWINPNKKS